MKGRHEYPAYLMAAFFGSALWLVSAKLSGRREPWDSVLYWTIAYPIAIVLSGVLGYVFPDRPWRWALVLMLSQFAAMAVKDGLGGMWPMGLALFCVLALPGMGLANIAARMRTKRDEPGRS